MKITIAYIAVTGGQLTEDYCSRFVASYSEFPPLIEHDTIVICNGGPLPYSTGLLFSSLKARFYPRKNDGGWDISGYIDAARGPCADADMMLCCGESIYFHRSGWLKRLADVWVTLGPGMYGSLSSNLIRSHLNTTGFCCPPSVLAAYPNKVASRQDRYEFEHGEKAFWRQVALNNMPVRMVTWDGIWDYKSWRYPSNIMWRGDQSNCLMWCQHTDRYVKMDASTKAKWARGADRPYK